MAASKAVKIRAIVAVLVTLVLVIVLSVVLSSHSTTTTTAEPVPQPQSQAVLAPVQPHVTIEVQAGPAIVPDSPATDDSVTAPHQVYTRSAESMQNWRVASTTVSPSQTHTFHWLFPARNMDWAHSQLLEISNPQSPRYGQWYTKQTIDMMTKPSLLTVNQVKSWLRGHGVSEEGMLDYGHMLTITTDIDTIETMFHTQMVLYASETTAATAVRCNGSYAIPQSLVPSFGHISGLLDMPQQAELSQYRGGSTIPAPTMPVQAQGTRSRSHRFKTMQSSTTLTCNFSGQYPVVLPTSLATAYNYDSRSTSSALINNGRRTVIVTGVASINSTSECYLQADGFLYPSQVGFTNTPLFGNSASDISTQTLCAAGLATPQSSADIQAVFSVIPTSVIGAFYNPTNGDIATIATAINAMNDATIPTVVAYNYYSTSDTDPSVPTADSALLRLALRGVTFVVGAGNQGAPGPYNADCVTSSGNINSARMTAGYPASSPYVLSVGSTDFLTDISIQNTPSYFTQGPSTGYPPQCQPCSNDAFSQLNCQKTLTREEGVNIYNPTPVSNGLGFSAGFTSGGGFANYATGADLSWQRTAVTNYLTVCPLQPSTSSCTLPASNLYNSNNRAFPDVSAYGNSFGFVENTLLNAQFGASSAAALWAGYISRLNEINPTKLGFVNPLLYQMAAAQPNTFNDITVGNNVNSQQYVNNNALPNNPTSTPCSGWFTAPGWDPVTGLGSPNLNNMIAYLRAHPYNGGGVIGDPVITGFHGHSMQVHGTPFEHYNLISTPTLQYNAQFTFLNEGQCTAELANRTACWSHTGTYLGEVAVLVNGHSESEVRIHVQAGSINEGLYVTIDDDTIVEPSTEVYSHDLYTLSYPNAFTATLTTGDYVITWHNSDQFLNQAVSMTVALDSRVEKFVTTLMKQGVARTDVSPKLDSSLSLPHGLLGQSWSESHYDNQWEWLAGNVDDYLLVDGLFGTQFPHNRYRYTVSAQ